MIRQRITSVFASFAVALAGVTLSVAPIESEAKRLGSGRASGMQRQMPAKQADSSPPAQNATPNQAGKPAQAAPANAAAPAAAQPAKRSWMGPIAGLAAGLGLAALASHLGFGEELANFMMMALLGVVAMVAIAWVARRMRGAQPAGPQLAGAGAPFQGTPASAGLAGAQQAMGSSMAREAHGVFGGGQANGASAAGFGAAAASARPEGFDADGFTRIAKMIFIRLQAANDEANLDDLRKFTTPELFASLRLDLQERGQSAQQTDVMQLDAELVDTAQENGQWVASVRFSGLIREEVGQGAEPFNELWHLVKPLDGGREWAIAGITPLQA
ncbi:Tim44 domain-containing protein [Aquabacterium sp. UBA2148]|uniref:Tim44 domain-containing protein n=1 Tax=Aquabacterium sp. UBA2148 TaxID=1946042 RepID=UPI0025795A98|nr:TIM44-like domain-containing protein [Aquabacterium sp. UBA2148]